MRNSPSRSDAVTNMPWWRAIINRSGGFVFGMIAMFFIVLGCWRAWGMPEYPGHPNIAHAGGGLDGYTYVNGVDAFNNSYANGFRLFEVDFSRTTDGIVVCSHDWHAFSDKAPSLAGFLEARPATKYPHCTFDELAAWFHAHPDAKLVADSKDDVLFINSRLRQAIGTQLIAEAYNILDLVNLATVDRNPPILSMYKVDSIPSRFGLITAMRYSPIEVSGVAMSVTDVWYGMALWAKIWVHRPVTVYTVNDCNIAPMLHFFGVDTVMTDTLMPHDCA
jgi:hypothetical protein